MDSKDKQPRKRDPRFVASEKIKDLMSAHDFYGRGNMPNASEKQRKIREQITSLKDKYGLNVPEYYQAS